MKLETGCGMAYWQRICVCILKSCAFQRWCYLMRLNVNPRSVCLLSPYVSIFFPPCLSFFVLYYVWWYEGLKKGNPSLKCIILLLFLKLLINLLADWVFIAAHGLSLVAVSGGFSCSGARVLGAWASVVVARGL